MDKSRFEIKLQTNFVLHLLSRQNHFIMEFSVSSCPVKLVDYEDSSDYSSEDIPLTELCKISRTDQNEILPKKENDVC